MNCARAKTLTRIILLNWAFPPRMHLFKGQNSAIILLSGCAFLGMTGIGSAPERTTEVSPEQFVRALGSHQSQVIEVFLNHCTNPNARVGQDRPILVSAILQGEKAIAQQLIKAGACVDLADENGLTPLMAASVMGDVDVVQQLLPLATNPAATDHQGRS